MSKITPFLWFDDRLEEAVNFYVSVFKDGKILNISRMPGADAKHADKAFSAEFELQGQRFMALNGGPEFTFTEAISFFVKCENQAEVDYYWNALTANGGEESQCAWLKDKFGLSWQIVPNALVRYLGDPDHAKAQRVMQAMLKMQKIDIAELDRAAAAA
jgi:predicted 3-demethylubiquinone-9 3-methyltransferase (glyoxalase superfamily)